ncbi:hypothetical protein [Listeria costaricensis]|uniref:hypothetical protein n=1 Tax=Listeria costaricensis TaxID=2026604 RepID=UPI000C07FD38|nr:hypothetical protein [Listeria costaricensis]
MHSVFSKQYNYNAFKRAYEDGNLYEQLDACMNTTRYADDIEKLGYPVDKFDLKMNQRVSNIRIPLKNQAYMILSVPMSEQFQITIYLDDGNTIHTYYDTSVKIKDVSIGNTTKTNEPDVSDQVIQQEEEESLAAAKKFTADLYHELYENN